MNNNAITINVIENDVLEPMINSITSLVAKAITRTFGPYGRHTLIQTPSTVYATKDGWIVARNTRVFDSHGKFSAPANAIKKLILDVAQAVLINAGDGTSTATISADYMNKRISQFIEEYQLDSRTVEILLGECTTMICEKLRDMAIPTNGNTEIIRKIATISTNWDSHMAHIITDIYEKTRNPIIQVENSGNTETSYEIIEGYDIVGRLELPNYCLTTESGTFEADNPVILTFNTAVSRQHVESLVYFGKYVEKQGRKLVVIAPVFDQDFIGILAAMNSQNAANGMKSVNLVPFKYYAKTVIDKDCVADFVSLSGGVLLSNQYDEIHEIFTGMAIKIKPDESYNKDRKKPSLQDKANVEKDIKKLVESALKLSGTCKHIVATDKFIRIEGLTNANEEEFEGRKRELKAILDEKYRQYVSDAAVTESIRIIRLRLGKMECKHGLIKVGGFGDAHISSKKDALDDAIRACEVAYNDGYVVDGGVAIAQAISSILNDQSNDKYKLSSDTAKEMMEIYQDTFINVAAIMYNNKFGSSWNEDGWKKSLDIATEYATNENKRGKCFDLITEKETDSLITPVDVLIEIVRGCMQLVLVNTTSNQFVFQNEDDLIREIRAENVSDDANRSNDD